jgi:hypothetical protein
MEASSLAYQHTETLLACRTPDSFALDTRVRAVNGFQLRDVVAGRYSAW